MNHVMNITSIAIKIQRRVTSEFFSILTSALSTYSSVYFIPFLNPQVFNIFKKIKILHMFYFAFSCVKCSNV